MTDQRHEIPDNDTPLLHALDALGEHERAATPTHLAARAAEQAAAHAKASAANRRRPSAPRLVGRTRSPIAFVTALTTLAAAAITLAFILGAPSQPQSPRDLADKTTTGTPDPGIRNAADPTLAAVTAEFDAWLIALNEPAAPTDSEAPPDPTTNAAEFWASDEILTTEVTF